MKKCAHCGEDFTKKKPSNEGKYCSPLCYHESRKRRKEVSCDHCGKLFEKVISRIERDNHNFCGHSCRNKYFLSKPMKDLTQGYMRTKIFEHKERKCEICGYDKYVEVHHIDKDTTNNCLSNLKILCPNHHKEAHLGILVF